MSNFNPTQDRDILNLARATEDAPAQWKITEMVGRIMGISDPKTLAVLNQKLAYAYAQGYIRGRDTGRARIVKMPELPTLEPGS